MSVTTARPIDEMLIRISKDGTILVEEISDQIVNSKFINPDDLFSCIKNSCSHVGIESGILPENTIFYLEEQDGTRRAIIRVPSGYYGISYYETYYSSFPLPSMVFGFELKGDGHISSKKLAIIEDGVIRKESKIYNYPFSNVNQSNFEICTGRNRLPEIHELRQLTSLPYLILAMPNNDDYFDKKYNKKGMDYRELMEYVKDKEPQVYYDEVLIDRCIDFEEFIRLL